MAIPARAIPRPTATPIPNIQEPPVREPKFWRILRLAVAIPLLLISAGAVMPLAVIPVSSQAVVNARLARVRSEISGEIIDSDLETGDVVNINQTVAKVKAAGIQASDAQEELRRRRDLEAQKVQLEAQMASNQRQIELYRKQQSEYGDRYASGVELQLRKAEHDRQAAEEAVSRAVAEVKRDEAAVKEHIVTRAVLDEANEKSERANEGLAAKSDAVDRLRKQLNDVKAGFYLTDAQQPRYVPLLEQAQSSLLEFQSQATAVNERLRAIDMEVAVQQTGAQHTTVITSPVKGVIWSRGIALGQHVDQGDDLFRVADASSVHVEVWLDRRYGPQISIGDVALIELSGLGKELSGQVTAFQGTSRRRLDEETNAIDLQPVHPDQYRVTIELAPSERKPNYIGQSAKVLFPGPRTHFKAKLYSWLSRL